MPGDHAAVRTLEPDARLGGHPPRLGRRPPRATTRPPRPPARARRATGARSDGTVVGAFGSTSSRAAVKTMPSRCARLGVGAHDHARGGGERVVALLARRRAGVVGAARELDLQAQPRGQPRDHAGRPVRGGDVARLVDVQLEEAAQPLEPLRRARQPRRVDAGVRHRVAERDPVLVHARERVVDVEPPDQRARAERRRVEARALLVGERDHGHRHVAARRPRSRRRRRARRRSARRARTRVEVRADRPPRRRARPGTPTGCRRGRAPCRRPIAAARRANQPAACLVLGASTPAASCRRRRRARSARGRRAAPRARRRRSRALPRRRSPAGDHRGAPGCGRSGRGCARPARRAARGRRACRPRSSPSSSDSRAPRRR